jgi:hypothetical protein
MYSEILSNINDNGVFLGVGILSLSFSLSFSLFIYGKLKSKKATHKDTENRIPNIQNQIHQMTSISRAKATSTPSSNPFVRLIMGFAGTGSGNGIQYQHLNQHLNEYDGEGEECGRESREANHTMKKPATAEAGSQVCQEIISKRERRSLSSECSGEADDDSAPREGFIQEIFESSASSSAPAAASCHENTIQVSDEEAKLSQRYTCAVCLDELCLGNTNMTTTSCGHTFHLSCLLKSLVQKNLCPMCRGELEDTRVKQMPANILTPVSAEQMIDEEITYYNVASHVQSITLSRHPKRRAKEMLRVFGFALLRTVAEYVHDENMPAGWFDDGGTDSESDTDDGEEEEGEEEEGETENDDEGEEGEETENEDEDELNYAVENERRQSRQQEEQQQANQLIQNTRAALRRSGRDLRNFISE